MANPHRGEVEVSLGGETFILRPTFEALAEIEKATGLGLVPFATKITTGSYGVLDVFTVLKAGIRAGGREPPKDLGQRIVEEGLIRLSDGVLNFLTQALDGGSKGAPGKAEAAPEA